MRPTIRSLPAAWSAAARGVAEGLAARGRRAWIVGGAVRDLALGREVHDVDLATDAPPEEIEAVFDLVHAVGRAFGTCVVRSAGRDVQVTTFRTEAGYGDGRRPDEVRFGTTLEEDARRRDFTCNALFLDPLTDELRDPIGGLEDLAAGRLRCVGRPEDRFREDGLRLVRLVRFAAGYGLTVEEATLRGARREADSLAGVSPERLLAELTRIAAAPGGVRATVLFDELDLFPRWPGLEGLPSPRERVEALGEPLPLALHLAALYAPAPGESTGEAGRRLARLRPARALQGEVEGIWDLARDALALARDPAASLADRLRAVRDPRWPAALRLARLQARGDEGRGLEALEALRAQRSTAELHPEPWVGSEDLRRLGVPRGPRWGELLRRAEDRRLEGRDADRAAALEWLRGEVARPSSGGREGTA